MSNARYGLAGWLRSGIAIIFIVAGLAKVADPVSLYWDIIKYIDLLGMELADSYVSWVAILLGPIECMLGFALLLKWKLKAVYPVTFTVMTFFFLLTYLAWTSGVDADCGCFGGLIERKPVEAMFGNAIVILILSVLWQRKDEEQKRHKHWHTKIIWIAVTMCFILVGAQHYFYASQINNPGLQIGTDIGHLVDREIGETDRQYLIVMFHPACPNCRMLVPYLNTLSGHPNSPPIIGLTDSEMHSEALKLFVEELSPSYTIAQVSSKFFTRFTWKRKLPLLFFVRDGIVKAIWTHGKLPGKTTLSNLMI